MTANVIAWDEATTVSHSRRQLCRKPAREHQAVRLLDYITACKQ